jgi:hypothetical protein
MVRHERDSLHDLFRQSLTLIDVCNTTDDEQFRRHSLEEGFELVHDEVVGLRCVEGSRDVAVVVDGFWFKAEVVIKIP